MSNNDALLPDFGDSSDDDDTSEEGLVVETKVGNNKTIAAATSTTTKKMSSSSTMTKNTKKRSSSKDSNNNSSQKNKKKKKEEEEGIGGPPTKKSRGLIDTAAVESGNDDDEEEEEEEDDEDSNNDYERDGFVVDEDDEEEEDGNDNILHKGKHDALEDSDDDDDDDDDDEDDSTTNRKKKRLKRNTNVLDDDDLDLINEARGVLPRSMNNDNDDDNSNDRVTSKDTSTKGRGGDGGSLLPAVVRNKDKKVTGRDEIELSKGLFTGDTDDEEEDNSRNSQQQQQQQKKQVLSQSSHKYDDDEDDDFIEGDDGIDDSGIGRGGGLHGSGGAGEGGISGEFEYMLQEHLDIFGVEFTGDGDMGGGGEDGIGLEGGGLGVDDYDDDIELKRKSRSKKYREHGVGVDYGVDSGEEIEDDSDDDDSDVDEDDDADLFGEDDADADDIGDKQRAEVLRLKREKRRMARNERNRLSKARIEAKRRAALRRAFEPVQLVENFCTERDEVIRTVDCPERYYDWLEATTTSTTTISCRPTLTIGDDITLDEDEEALWIMQKIPAIHSEWLSYSTSHFQSLMGGDDEISTTKDRLVLDSIVYALRYMRFEKLEPDFIRRYRQDVVSSPSVRDNLYNILDEDGEWERMTDARSKIEGMLTSELTNSEEDELIVLQNQLQTAEDKLQEVLNDEERVQEKIRGLEADQDKNNNDDDDDDDLFGDDDDDDKNEKKSQELESLRSHLNAITALLNAQSTEVARLDSLCREKESLMADGGSTTTIRAPSFGAISVKGKMMCKDKLWHYGDYSEYVLSMTEYQQVTDMKVYLNLIKEGNQAIQDKTSLVGNSSRKKDAKEKKRSRRFDWDYYRTCVSEGLRAVSYKFILPPFRAGIKLEETLTSKTGFSYDRLLPGEENSDYNTALQWSAPVIDGLSPQEFSAQMIDSGDLVILAAAKDDAAWDETPEMNDPLRACRYVAAMELAHEPRIRCQLRSIYRSEAVITTRPTSKGMEEIDAFHECYGLHLIKEKPIKEYFPMSTAELGQRNARLNAEEVKEHDIRLKQKETDNCIQYLKLLKAERSGHISLQVHLPYLNSISDTPWYKSGPDTLSREGQDISRLMETLTLVYYPANDDTDEWNEERKKILRMALVNYLLPQFEAEIRRDLRVASMRIGVVEAGKNLRQMAMTGPYRPSHLLGENRFIVPTGDLPIVAVCSSNDARDGTYLAAVNGRGELSDHVGVTDIKSDQAREKIITFLMQTRPAAVVVGSGGGVGSRATARRIGEFIATATERWNNRFIQGEDEDDEDFDARVATYRMMNPENDEDEEQDMWKCNVDIVDDNVAQLFGRSVRGKKEFPDSAMNLKVAIAAARWAKDPLCELTYTWSVASDAGMFGTEMLFLNVHPLQRILPKPLLLREYQRVLCEVTAEVGVDINGACTHIHMNGLLSFVPGLGPRKASILKQNVSRIGGVVSSRKSILAKRLLGPIVYNNAAAFLRVRATDQLRDQLLHPLDDTRCHPDLYHRYRYAIQIAVDALEAGDVTRDEDGVISAIRDIMDNSQGEVKRLFLATKDEYERTYCTIFPSSSVHTWDPKQLPGESWRDKVEDLDIEAFAEIIAKGGDGKWLSHLTMVKWEFRLPYVDPRNPMVPPSGETLFKLLTGESDATLCPGKEVTGMIVKNGDFGSQVKLEGDVPGFIPLRNLADDHVESAEDIVSVGTVVTALITQVKMDHMCVDLTLKKEDFRKKSSEWERPMSLPPLDDNFDKFAALKIDDEKDKNRQARLEALSLTMGSTKIQGADINADIKRSGKATRRACAHPAFRNAAHDVVDRELKENGDVMVGDALIRPSNKSCDSLAIHWMVRPGCIKVIEVIEQDKVTDASIGNRLLIKKEVYESIDELLGRYIAPMNDRVEEVQHHRKFLDKLEDDVDDILQEMRSKSPSGVFYFICWSESYPGYVSLRFILGKTPRHHTIAITPDGFVWGSKAYSNMDRLMNDFKKNPSGPGAKSYPPTAGNGSMQGSAVGRSEETRQSRWGAKSAVSVGWGGTALPPPGLPPAFAPPPGLPPTYAAPPGQPPTFSY